MLEPATILRSIGLVLIIGGLVWYFKSRTNSNGASRFGQKIGTPHLDQFAVDLVAIARRAEIDPVVGRDKEILRATQVLTRRTKNNVILVGPPGVGKTAIVEGLALRIATGDVPTVLTHKRILSLRVSELLAGTKYRGEFEQRIKGLVDDIRLSARTIILFIDEIHIANQTYIIKYLGKDGQYGILASTISDKTLASTNSFLCNDGDGGKNYGTSASTTITIGGEVALADGDSCVSAVLLKEVYCLDSVQSSNSESGLIGSVVYDCSTEGKICSKDTCVPPSPKITSCIDSDGGSNVNKKGTVTLLGDGGVVIKEVADSCSTSKPNNIIEQFCMSAGWGSTVVSCGNLMMCSDGACIPK